MRRMAQGLLLALIVALTLAPAAAQDEVPVIVSPALEADMQNLEQITERLRALETLDPVDRRFPSRADVIVYLQSLYDEDMSADDLARSTLFYTALGLLDADVDLRAVYLSLLSSQVGGFYDTDTKSMNVIPLNNEAIGASLTLTEQIVYVHEYVHALQDQHFGLDALIDSEESADHPDRSLAALSLIEGDASAIMNLYLQRVSMQNPMAALQLLTQGLQAGNLFLPPDVPSILVNELLFPYEAGMTFVLAVYGEGGWDALNAAYANLPQTSEQIIHPDKYLSGEGAAGVMARDTGALLGEGWSPVWQTALGEFYLREHLKTELPTRRSATAAAGWGGDSFQLYRHDDSGAAAWTLDLVWDSADDAREFAEAYAALGEARYGTPAQDGCWGDDDGALCLRADANGSQVSAAPTLDLARRLMNGA